MMPACTRLALNKGKKMKKHYAERDLLEMDRAGNFYGNHVMAMTAEQLRSKSDIAAELGWRDMHIATLQQKLDAVVAKGMELAQEAAHVYAEYNKEMAPDVVCDGQTIQEFHDLANGRSSVEAYLNSVRAEGLEMLAEQCDDYPTNHVYSYTRNHALEFAAQLRADAAKDGE